jgi:hypothetical protein
MLDSAMLKDIATKKLGHAPGLPYRPVVGLNSPAPQASSTLYLDPDSAMKPEVVDWRR